MPGRFLSPQRVTAHYTYAVQLSIIVCIVDGGDQLGRCLAALARQQDAPALDVIVPWDDHVTGIDAFVRAYPQFSFPAIGAVQTVHDPRSHAGLHELYDRRRTVGLHAATGDLIGLLEDRSVPDPDWAAQAVALHAAHRNGVIGGALADGRHTLVGHADYLCDFYRYQPPFVSGERDFVSYVNICYKREALERTRSVWSGTYYDLEVHNALTSTGERLWLASELQVQQQRGDGESLAVLIGERFAWGRRFARHRTVANKGAGRWRFAAQSPLVPIVLWLRVMRRQQGGAALMRAIAATPAMLLIFGAWGFGELLGSVSDAP